MSKRIANSVAKSSRAQPRPVAATSVFGASRPLEQSTRSWMEGWFGTSLSDIRIHDDHAAASLADRWNARALTRGSDIYFGSGMYRPDRFEGRRLLGHEVAHSLQQRGSSNETAGDNHEREAHRAGDAIAAGHGWNLRTHTRSGQLQFDIKAPHVATGPDVPTSVLLDLVTHRLDDLEATKATGVDRAVTRLESVITAASRAGGKDSTVERQAQLRQIVTRLNDYLVQATPKFVALAGMEDPKNYLPNLADRIVKHVQDCESSYVLALLAADTTDDATQTFDLAVKDADTKLSELPRFIVAQYLDKDEGVSRMIRKLKPEVDALNRLREATHKQAFSSRKAERLLGLDPPGSWSLNPTSLIKAFTRGLESIHDGYPNHKDVSEPLRQLVLSIQQAHGLILGMQIYEQLEAYDRGLDSWINDTMEATFWSNVQSKIHSYKQTTDGLLTRLEIGGTLDDKAEERIRSALLDMASMLDTNFTAVTDAAASRLHTIAIIEFVGKSIAITAVAALTAGVAAEYAGAYAVTAGSADLAGSAAFVAQVFTFTAVSRVGQSMALDGGAQGSFVGDLVTNALMFGMLDKINGVFGALAKKVPKAWKIPVGLGKFATGMVALQGFAEVETVLKGGTPFKDLGASTLQNLVMTVALEAGHFIGEPLANRLVAPAIKAKFEKLWGDLEASRIDIHARLDALSRGTLKPEDIADLLHAIYTQWGAELQLLSSATTSKGKEKPILSDAEAKPILAKYEAKLAELQLHLAKLNLGLPVAFGSGPVMFRPLKRGLVGFSQDPKALDMIAAAYQRVPGGSFKPSRSKAFPKMWEGRLPNGDLTYYIPLEAAAGRLPDQSKVVVARDAAVGASAGDDVAADGMQRLTNSFSHLNMDEILASVADGDLAGFLRFVADPGFAKGAARSLGAEWFRRVADSPEAVRFGRRYGATALKNLQKIFGWTPELTKTLVAIDVLAEAAPDVAAMLDQVAKAKKPADIDALLGKSKPVKPRKPRVRATKTKLKVDRTRDTWTTFRAEAAKFATDHRQTPTDAQLDSRADLYQFLADAKAGRFQRYSPESRVTFLDAFDAVAKEAGMLQEWINALRGNVLAEALFIPNYGKFKKPVFYNGKQETGSRSIGSTEPDYPIPGEQFTEWVNLKSDLIDSSAAAAKAAAKKYLAASKLEAANLPPGDKYSLDFIRKPPNKQTVEEMLEILFAKGSPIYRVKIGTTWYDAKGPVVP